MKINFSTIHRSKGLEADVVIVLNNINDINGFPSQKSTDPLLQLIDKRDSDEIKREERRVFYVAVTRAKKRIILITVNFEQSEYIEEILSNNEFDKEISDDNGYECYIEKYISEQEEKVKICDICGHPMEKRKRNEKEIWGCTSYPYCTNKEKID